MATINIGLFLLLILMTFMGSIAALFLKKASGFKSIKDLLTNVNLYIGAGLYLASAVINVFILKFVDYSIVLPLTSITYVWTMFISYLVLKEKIGVKKIVGITLVIIGCICIVL